ncbi:DUF1028 domain-containing protein [Candidatus Bathyarchaeota archaeon]|nr:DUF1028 domain-containing protein [Candidatus Bathyarchaeota archaeon]
MKNEAGTFTIIALSREQRQIGVAVASGSPAVGSRVPHVKPGTGAVATQAYTNVSYGLEGLKMMARGVSPAKILSKLLTNDSGKEMRQVAIMDFSGRKAFFTGSLVPEFCGEIIGEDYIVIGNLMRSLRVLEGMAAEYERLSGDLAWRLARTLEAGRVSGGDKRGEASAALVVADAEKTLLNIRVDLHPNPIQELWRKLSLYNPPV